MDNRPEVIVGGDGPNYFFMSGVQFVIDDRGRRTAAVIDLKEHGQLWEDFYDTLTSISRESEPRESLEFVRNRIRNSRKSDG